MATWGQRNVCDTQVPCSRAYPAKSLASRRPCVHHESITNRRAYKFRASRRYFSALHQIEDRQHDPKVVDLAPVSFFAPAFSFLQTLCIREDSMQIPKKSDCCSAQLPSGSPNDSNSHGSSPYDETFAMCTLKACTGQTLACFVIARPGHPFYIRFSFLENENDEDCIDLRGRNAIKISIKLGEDPRTGVMFLTKDIDLVNEIGHGVVHLLSSSQGTTTRGADSILYSYDIDAVPVLCEDGYPIVAGFRAVAFEGVEGSGHQDISASPTSLADTVQVVAEAVELQASPRGKRDTDTHFWSQGLLHEQGARRSTNPQVAPGGTSLKPVWETVSHAPGMTVPFRILKARMFARFMFKLRTATGFDRIKDDEPSNVRWENSPRPGIKFLNKEELRKDPVGRPSFLEDASTNARLFRTMGFSGISGSYLATLGLPALSPTVSPIAFGIWGTGTSDTDGGCSEDTKQDTAANAEADATWHDAMNDFEGIRARPNPARSLSTSATTSVNIASGGPGTLGFVAQGSVQDSGADSTTANNTSSDEESTVATKHKMTPEIIAKNDRMRSAQVQQDYAYAEDLLNTMSPSDFGKLVESIMPDSRIDPPRAHGIAKPHHNKNIHKDQPRLASFNDPLASRNEQRLPRREPRIWFDPRRHHGPVSSYSNQRYGQADRYRPNPRNDQRDFHGQVNHGYDSASSPATGSNAGPMNPRRGYAADNLGQVPASRFLGDHYSPHYDQNNLLGKDIFHPWNR